MQRLFPQHCPFSVHDVALGRQQRQSVVASQTEPSLLLQQAITSLLPSRRQASPSPAQGRQ
jgi:hypothetical protein